jgi:hypothetical protein
MSGSPFNDILNRLAVVIGSITAGGKYNYTFGSINQPDRAKQAKTKPAVVIDVVENEVEADDFPSDFHSENIVTLVKFRIYNFVASGRAELPLISIREPLLKAEADIITALENNRTLNDGERIYCQNIKYQYHRFEQKKNNDIIAPTWLDSFFHIWWGYIRGSADQSAYR